MYLFEITEYLLFLSQSNPQIIIEVPILNK